MPSRYLSQWLQQLLGHAHEMPNLSTLRKSLTALSQRKQKLAKRPENTEKIEAMLQAEYQLPRSRSSLRVTSPAVSDSPAVHPSPFQHAQPSLSKEYLFQKEVLEKVNKDLAIEARVWKQKYEEQQEHINSMVERIRQYNPHNVRRREKRKEVKLKKQKKAIKELKKKSNKASVAFQKAIAERSLAYYYKKKCEILMADTEEIACESEQEVENKELKERLSELEEINIKLNEQVKQLEERPSLVTYEDGHYTDDVRTCVIELLTHNVSIFNVEPVIRSVLKLAKIDCDRLPKHTVINNMLAEARALSHMQLVEALTESSNNTLHSDCTTKFGHKFSGYQMSTVENSYTLGLRETSSGSASTMLGTLQEIIADIEEVSTETDAGKKILANIKSTMSDRASTQKAFNDLLTDYRSGVLPQVIEEWDKLSEEEKLSMSSMYNFFCGMHLVVNMAECSSESLRLFEDSTSTPNPHGESGPVNLIRIVSKAFEKRGDQKSGCPVKFSGFLRTQGVRRNPFAHFHGNRFNILFHNAAAVYFLRPHIVQFLTQVNGVPNKLLAAVLTGIQNNFNLAACKALGLIDKFITGPLWRVLESDIHILDMPEKYRSLLKFLQRCTSSTMAMQEFMTGETVPFPASLIKKDQLWEHLVLPSDLDPLCLQILVALFKSFELLVDRFLQQGEQDNIASEHETKSVKPTNTISERDFAKMDRLIREKPNASVLAIEAHVLFTNNKTTEWLSSKSPTEKEVLFSNARKLAPLHQKKFRARLDSLQQQIEIDVAEKQRQLQEKEAKAVAEKERLTAAIVSAGLWQSMEQVDKALQALPNERQKKDALKTQLKFRKVVLQQTHPDPSVFHFSQKGTAFSSQILKENLASLLGSAADQCEEILTDSCPDLEGCRVHHKFIEEGEIVVYTGQVISRVSGFPEWFNIVYDKEPDVVYTYKLMDDIAAGDLTIIT